MTKGEELREALTEEVANSKGRLHGRKPVKSGDRNN